MKSKDKNPKTILEQALNDIRRETVDPEQVERAAARVWSHLSSELQPTRPSDARSDAPLTDPAEPARGEKLRDCSDFQALIPAYRSGNLSAARALLLDDHTHACVPCRKALDAARRGRPEARPTILTGTAVDHSYRQTLAWGLAAVLLIGIGLARFDLLKPFWGSPPAVPVTAQAVEGTLFRVAGQSTRPLAVGETIGPQEDVRTAMNSGAVLQLADGSRIEMKERSALSLAAGRDGVNVRLARGSIIVSAAKQRSGHLYVSTPDCLVSVTGTVFAVNRGTKGSRVSVLEGEVWVEQGKTKTALRPGQQLATDAAAGAVPLEREIAWSKQVEAHMGLLRAFSAVRQERAPTSDSGLRYTSKLLPLVPPGTVVYAAFPNISATLGEAYDIFQRQIRENPALRQWWDEAARASQGRSELEEMIAKVRTLGEFLGDEIVVTVPKGDAGAYDDPVVLAEVRRPDDLATFLQAEAARLRAQSPESPALRIINNPAELLSPSRAGARENALTLFMYDHVVAASSSLRPLQKVAVQQQNPSASPFLAGGFYARIAEAYADGVGWLFAADMETLFSGATQKQARAFQRAAEEAWLRQVGVADVQHLLIERKSVAGRTENQAVLSFNQARRGMAAWLAPPAPMGALEFVSPETYAAAAFVMKEPAMILDELLGFWQKFDPPTWQSLRDFEAQHGVDIRADMAAPLGGEFLVALDGPLLPSPSWKVVVEVYDPARFQKTLEWAVTEINREAGRAGKPGLSLVREVADGKVFYKLIATETGYEIHYLFWDGYLVAAPSRTLLIQSLQYRATGYTLSQSPGFRAQLPVDGRAHCSALFYQNVLSAAGALAQYVPEAKRAQSPEPLRSLQEVAAGTPPTLLCLYGEKDRIILAGRGDLIPNLGTLAGWDGLQRMLAANPGAHKTTLR